MRQNTPPRHREMDQADGDFEIDFEDDVLADEEQELEEISMEELEERFGCTSDESEDDINDKPWPHPERDDAAVTFTKHTRAGFGCGFHPYLPLAVTGGEDDRAFVFNIHTGELVYDVIGHKDTVTDVTFSHDGTYLATGDMSGELFIHKLEENESGGPVTFRRVWDYSMGDMNWLLWHRASNVLFAGSESGEIYMWRIPSGDCKILPGSRERTNAADLAFDGKKLFVGYSDGVVKLWDLKSGTVIMEVNEQNPMAHNSAVLCINCEKESPLYASGSLNGKVLFCTNNGAVGAVEADGSVECIAFAPSNELKLVASGTLKGQIAIWDYGKYTLRTICDHTYVEEGVESERYHGGITGLAWLNEHTIVASTISGIVFAFEARSGARKFILEGHMAEIYSMKYNPLENILLTVSEDHRAKIFNVPALGD